jgi:hypothetical protein
VSITVTITKTLDSLWAEAEALAAMTDEEIVRLCREDLIEFADKAEWVVRRGGARSRFSSAPSKTT